MFHSARLKLTAWYLLILMGISIFFSITIYRQTTIEVERSLRSEEVRLYRENHPFTFIRPEQIELNQQALNDADGRIKLVLLFINLGIFGLSGAAGYFLAGRTLKPIKHMLDEQHRFITDASHELRTPLTSLRSEIEVGLRNKKITLLESKHLLESNLEEVIALQVLSDNLLELAQNGKIQDTKNMSEFSIKEVIDNSIKKISPLMQSKQITLTTNIKEVKIKGAMDRLTEVFVILLDNAIKYSPQKTKITISVKIEKQMALVKVADAGIGIDQEDLLRVFDRFYRANKSRSKQEIPGYGLGLSIAKKIIESHKGTITVTSQLHKGSVFIVSLPESI